MNAPCGDKKTKGSETRQEYMSSSTEMAPFFSSIDVNDAGKPGLTSNKVALHEKFTVSLQRFAQLSAACRPSASPCPCSEECAHKECHRLSTLHMPATLTSTKTQGFSCPFFGTTTVGDSKSTGSNALFDTVAIDTEGDRRRNRAAKTVDAQVPSIHTTLDEAELNDGQAVCDHPAADMTKLVKGAQYLSIGDGVQSASDSRQDVASQSKGHAIVGYENAGGCAEERNVIIEDDLKHCRESLPDARCVCDSMVENSSKLKLETALPHIETEVFPKSTEGLSSTLDTHNRENAVNAASDTPDFSVRNKCGVCGESANKTRCHCGVAESLQEGIGMGKSPNDSESCFASSLSPKAVIQEIGQLRFWKARLALIRQQRVFSEQVFELHKLIEVQRILAGTPHMSMGEIYFGVGNMNLQCDADGFASNKCPVDKNEDFGDALGKQLVVLEQAVEVSRVAGEAKAKSINSQACLQQSLAAPNAKEVGVSAWGCSSLGVRHTTGTSPASGACPYRPLGGSFGAPRVGLEGAAMIQSPVFPFSFPVGLQEPQVTQSAIASSPRQHSAPYHSFSSGLEVSKDAGQKNLNKTCGASDSHQQYSAPYHNSGSGLEVSDHSRQKSLNKTSGASEGPAPPIAAISSWPDTPQQRV